jgi:hypothetical protein
VRGGEEDGARSGFINKLYAVKDSFTSPTCV